MKRPSATDALQPVARTFRMLGVSDVRDLAAFFELVRIEHRIVRGDLIFRPRPSGLAARISTSSPIRQSHQRRWTLLNRGLAAAGMPSRRSHASRRGYKHSTETVTQPEIEMAHHGPSR